MAALSWHVGRGAPQCEASLLLALKVLIVAAGCRLCGVVVHRPLNCLGISGGRARPQQLDGAAAAADADAAVGVAGGGGGGGGGGDAVGGSAEAAAPPPLLAAAELSLDDALREPLDAWAEEQKVGGGRWCAHVVRVWGLGGLER